MKVLLVNKFHYRKGGSETYYFTLADALKQAHRLLSGTRVSDGFDQLAEKKQLKLSLEALVVDKRFTALFTDDEANEALSRLLSAGYYL